MKCNKVLENLFSKAPMEGVSHLHLYTTAGRV